MKEKLIEIAKNRLWNKSIKPESIFNYKYQHGLSKELCFIILYVFGCLRESNFKDFIIESSLLTFPFNKKKDDREFLEYLEFLKEFQFVEIDYSEMLLLIGEKSFSYIYLLSITQGCQKGFILINEWNRKDMVFLMEPQKYVYFSWSFHD